MNAPRGGEIFTLLSEGYTDGIPLSFHASIDRNRHRVGKDPIEGPRIGKFMIDALFSLSGIYSLKCAFLLRRCFGSHGYCCGYFSNLTYLTRYIDELPYGILHYNTYWFSKTFTMNTTGVWILVAVVVVGMGTLLVFRDGTNTIETQTGLDSSSSSSSGSSSGEGVMEEPPSMEIMKVTVTITDEGYDPKEITIQKGQAVTWVNNSSKPVWTASAQHPTHTAYPEKTDVDCLGSAFDACKGIPSGESWSFTFNEVGSWGYHDHLNARHDGKVIVTE